MVPVKIWKVKTRVRNSHQDADFKFVTNGYLKKYCEPAQKMTESLLYLEMKSSTFQ